MGEPVVRLEPVADGALVAPVDLEHVNGQLVTGGVERVEVAAHRVLVEVEEVLVPAAPSRLERRRGASAAGAALARRERVQQRGRVATQLDVHVVELDPLTGIEGSLQPLLDIDREPVVDPSDVHDPERPPRLEHPGDDRRAAFGGSGDGDTVGLVPAVAVCWWCFEHVVDAAQRARRRKGRGPAVVEVAAAGERPRLEPLPVEAERPGVDRPPDDPDADGVDEHRLVPSMLHGQSPRHRSVGAARNRAHDETVDRRLEGALLGADHRSRRESDEHRRRREHADLTRSCPAHVPSARFTAAAGSGNWW